MRLHIASKLFTTILARQPCTRMRHVIYRRHCTCTHDKISTCAVAVGFVLCPSSAPPGTAVNSLRPEWRHMLPCSAFQLKHTRPPWAACWGYCIMACIICMFMRSFFELQAGLAQTGLAQSTILGSGRCSQEAGAWTRRLAAALQMTQRHEVFSANSSVECSRQTVVNSWIVCPCVGPGAPLANPHATVSDCLLSAWSVSALGYRRVAWHVLLGMCGRPEGGNRFAPPPNPLHRKSWQCR